MFDIVGQVSDGLFYVALRTLFYYSWRIRAYRIVHGVSYKLCATTDQRCFEVIGPQELSHPK